MFRLPTTSFPFSTFSGDVFVTIFRLSFWGPSAPKPFIGLGRKATDRRVCYIGALRPLFPFFFYPLTLS